MPLSSRILRLAVVFFYAALASLTAQAADEVTTESGMLQGTTNADHTVRIFKGIPFAAPPVGDLRWKAPQPTAKWTGIRKADKYGSACLQTNVFGDIYFRDNQPSEDCLNLVIWAPAKLETRKLPVLVWFYGGGFVAGANSEPRYDGEKLASKGIIVVEPNYRLGVFGFFSHPELTKESGRNASGNYGLLDQVAALQWVVKNIAAFGGDPHNITIAGESAGSLSVSALMASSLSRDLFQKAVGESGAFFPNGSGQGILPKPVAETEQAGAKFAESLGAATLAQMRTKPAQELLQAAAQRDRGFGFGPNIDGYFLPAEVRSIYEQGEQSHVPLLAGWNGDEGKVFVLFNPKPTPKTFADKAQARFGGQAAEFLKLYPATTDEEAIRSAEALAGDDFIAYSTWKWIDLHRQTSGAPVYQYHFEQVPATKPGAMLGPLPASAAGSKHAGEIEYVFATLKSQEGVPWTDDDFKLSEAMASYWVNFIKTGDPDCKGLPEWPKSDGTNNFQVMHLLGRDIRAASDSLRPRYEFLDRQTVNPKSVPAQAESKVNDLLGQMTLEEKVAQLSQLPGFPLPEFKEQNGVTPEEAARKYGAGSVLWVSDPKEINRWQHIAVDESRLHIPILFGLDVIHGYHTIFPSPIAMASSWDPKMVEAAQSIAAREARAAGIAWTFGPMVDIARDARWGRMMEGAGEDPYLGAAMARAQVLGFQGEQLGGPDHVMASVKHFAGYGAADGGRDYDASYIPEELMWNVYLPPFKAAIDAGAGTVMSAYMDLNDVPASGNRWLLHDVLREAWQFKGFVVSDANAVHSLITHGYARNGADATFKAFSVGLNMDMASGTYLKFLAQEVQVGRISTQQIDDAVRPILTAKIRLGLFEHPYVDESRINQVLNDPQSQLAARAAVQRSVVLLRNEGGVLPLDKKRIRSIAVIGPLADAETDLLSMWGALAKPGPTFSILQGIKAKAGSSVQVGFAHGPNLWRDIPSFFEEIPNFLLKAQPEQSANEAKKATEDAVALAKRSDLAILVLGEINLMSGEAASRSSLKLSGGQQELLEAVVATGKPVVLVLVNGRPLDIAWAVEHVPAILEAWYPGSQGGNGVADILFGDADPAGHLPVSWPRTSGAAPVYYNHNLTQAPEDSKDFKSRYWDVRSTPLFPFGYGLSYTTFSFDNLKLSETEAKAGANLEVSVDVANTGTREGDAVVQLYIHQRAGSASRPVRQLKGFRRVSLAAGVKQTVHFTLGRDELQFWSPVTQQWVVEPEQFDVWVGEDSTAKLHAEFRLTQ